MAINCYSGLQGSGKSYEVVSSVILAAIAQCRRVVTNIDGIDNDLIRAYVAEKHSLSLDKLGHIVHVTNAQVESPFFFPCGEDHHSAVKTVKGLLLGTNKEPPIVQPGDLVAIDEAYKFWGTDCKIHNQHKIFFREHRHYTHPDTGVACDLVLMTQDIGDLHRLLKVVIELSFRTHKAKGLGLNTVYTVRMWEGWKQAEKLVIQDWTRTYNPDIFPLYKSYAGEQQGKEVAADTRQNIFSNKRLLFKIAFFVIAACIGLWRSFHFFYDKIHPETAATQTVSTAKPVSPPKPVASQEWRIAGIVFNKGIYQVFLTGNNAIRLEPISSFHGSGYAFMGNIDGVPVTYFSGPAPTFTSKK